MFKHLSIAAVALAMLTAPTIVPANAEPAKDKKEMSEAQKKAAEHRKQCAQEWKEAKAAKKVEKGMTWPKFNGACMKRLSGNT